jgi:hypothetical protein
MDVQKVWSKLLSVQELIFEARSHASPNTGWNGTGKGTGRSSSEGSWHTT